MVRSACSALVGLAAPASLSCTAPAPHLLHACAAPSHLVRSLSPRSLMSVVPTAAAVPVPDPPPAAADHVYCAQIEDGSECIMLTVPIIASLSRHHCKGPCGRHLHAQCARELICDVDKVHTRGRGWHHKTITGSFPYLLKCILAAIWISQKCRHRPFDLVLLVFVLFRIPDFILRESQSQIVPNSRGIDPPQALALGNSRC